MKNRTTLIYLAWMVALISTAGSMFLSQYLNLPPCNLCWYQRICMFPLVVTLGVGFSLQDAKVHYYSLPLVAIGFALAAYHNLLYYSWIHPTITPCSGGVSCTERQLDLFGFLSIPLMSLISFSVLLVLLLIFHSKGKVHATK